MKNILKQATLEARLQINSNKDCLIYVGDAMCSWCYGFSPELDFVLNKFPELELKLVMGGLRPYSTKKAIDMAGFLEHHWKEVHQRSGQPFSFEILKDEKFIYDTEPASRAIIVARRLNPLIEYDFFKAVQISFYKENKNTNNIETYLELAKNYQLDIDSFNTFYNSKEAKILTKQDFELTAKLGVKGFPSLILKKEKQLFQLSNGYNTAKIISKTMEQIH